MDYSFNFAIINTYFDFDDYVSPVKNYIDNTVILNFLQIKLFIFIFKNLQKNNFN